MGLSEASSESERGVAPMVYLSLSLVSGSVPIMLVFSELF